MMPKRIFYEYDCRSWTDDSGLFIPNTGDPFILRFELISVLILQIMVVS
jgi:hypothetical protein